MALSFLSSSSCASIHPTTSPMMERYRSNSFPCCGGIQMGGWRRYSLICSKAFWHSSFNVCGSFFLKSLKMGSQVEVSLAMNRLMYCNQPKKPLISFSLLGGGISNVALILDGQLLSLYHSLGSQAIFLRLPWRYIFVGSTSIYIL